MLPTRSPKILQLLYPSLVWNMPDKDNTVYLTFDDGPHPNITSWVMDELDKYNFKATFFCIGDNVRKYPKVYHEILHRGHHTGNHTFNHLRGFQTENKVYLDNTAQCAQWVESRLFRPPHGQLKPSQLQALKPNYQIIMWSLLVEDWNANLNLDLKFEKLKSLTRSGDIIVFHDSEKAEKQMKVLLPIYLEFLKTQNFNVKLFH